MQTVIVKIASAALRKLLCFLTVMTVISPPSVFNSPLLICDRPATSVCRWTLDAACAAYFFSLRAKQSCRPSGPLAPRALRMCLIRIVCVAKESEKNKAAGENKEAMLRRES